MGNPGDGNDQTKERQSVKAGWEHLRQHELELLQMLLANADEAQERARRLKAAGNLQAAAEASRQEQVFLQEADDMVLDAQDALRRKGDLEKEDEEG